MTEPAGPDYTPNHVPLGLRLFYLALSLGLLAYGTFGLWTDDLFIPAKRGPGTHLHGLAAWLMFAAMACAALNMLSVIVDHFDTRNNETNYRRFARLAFWAGWVFFGLSFAWQFYVIFVT